MSQTSRDTAIRRIEAGLERLSAAIRQLPENVAQQSSGKETVSRETHETLKAAHTLLRTRAEAAVAGIDRLLDDRKER